MVLLAWTNSTYKVFGMVLNEFIFITTLYGGCQCVTKYVPGSNNLRLFAGNLDLGLFEKTADMSHRSDGSCYEPR